MTPKQIAEAFRDRKTFELQITVADVRQLADAYLALLAAAKTIQDIELEKVLESLGD